MICALLSILLLGSADVADAKRVAVLEFENQVAGLDRVYFSDAVRAAISRMRPDLRLLTRENITEVLAAQGKTLAECEGECEVETGRLLGADLVVSGRITSVGSRLKLTLRLHETRTGTLTGTAQASGGQQEELDDGVVPAVAQLIRDRADDQPSEGAFVARSASAALPDVGVVVSFASTPAGSIVHADGKLVCSATPCARTLTRGPHVAVFEKEEHRSETVAFDTAAGQPVSATLQPLFGVVSLEVQPPDLAVTIDGRAASAGENRLAPGMHEIRGAHRCRVEVGERVRIAAGASRTVRLVAPPREGAIVVTAEDGAGNALTPEVKVDGVPVGRAPGSFLISLCAAGLELKNGAHVWRKRLALEAGAPTAIKARFDHTDPDFVGTPRKVVFATRFLSLGPSDREDAAVVVRQGNRSSRCAGPLCEFDDLEPGPAEFAFESSIADVSRGTLQVPEGGQTRVEVTVKAGRWGSHIVRNSFIAAGGAAGLALLTIPLGAHCTNGSGSESHCNVLGWTGITLGVLAVGLATLQTGFRSEDISSASYKVSYGGALQSDKRRPAVRFDPRRLALLF
jgi:hypothetical protein